MYNPIINKAYKTITWQDRGNTEAIGWIVIQNIVNGVAGGGLFMHESASLQEVEDLAHTMSLKNSLQSPMFGGGKGGIKFDPKHPEAPSVLKRFLYDNREIIQNEWCTGGDLNTTTKEISDHLVTSANIKSPFVCLADMLKKNKGIEIQLDKLHERLFLPENDLFTIDQMVTGYSLFKILEIETKTTKIRPKILIQGFGKVARAFCYWAQSTCDIVGICERDWYIYNSQGLYIDPLLYLKIDDIHLLNSNQNFQFVGRDLEISSEDFLMTFLKQVQGDIFCPCAVRYSITRQVLNTLIFDTLSHSSLNNPIIISGANNVFDSKELVIEAFKNNLTVFPEWLTNSGSALLFMEALKYQHPLSQWSDFIKQKISERIGHFLITAKNLSHLHKLNIYDACCYLAHLSLGEENQRLNRVA